MPLKSTTEIQNDNVLRQENIPVIIFRDVHMVSKDNSTVIQIGRDRSLKDFPVCAEDVVSNAKIIEKSLSSAEQESKTDRHFYITSHLTACIEKKISFILSKCQCTFLRLHNEGSPINLFIA